MPDPWPPWLLAKARLLLFRGYRYTPGPPEALVDSETGDVVDRVTLERLHGEEIAARPRTPAQPGQAIGFRR